MNDKKKVNKEEYEVFEFFGGSLGISKIGTDGGIVVFAFDSRTEKAFDWNLFDSIYENWDGTLTHSGDDMCGEEGYIIMPK